MRYTADFETITDPNDCRVWAYGICSIDTLSFEYGNNIHDFMDWCKQENNPTLYFHNLKFDGSFILSYLLENSYKWVKDKKEATNRTFTTLIDTSGKFYQIEVYFKVYNKKYSKVTFLNSLNILPFSIAKIAQAFNLPLVKGEIDYDLFRPIGHELTIEEKLYLKNDCEIAARALSFLFNHDPPLTAMTQASNGLLHLKEVIGIDNFKRHFPILCDKTAQTDYDKYIVDTEIRRSYKGGYCDVKKDIVCKEINEPGIILDVNSLYPWVMATCDLPHGVPVPFKGKYTHSNDYPLFIQLFSCQFDLKLDKIPTIQLKNNGRFSE